MSGATAGWYPDPYDSTQMRWFDGTAWTESTQPMVSAVGHAADGQAAAGYTQPAAAQDSGWSSVSGGASASGSTEGAAKKGLNPMVLIGGGIAAAVVVVGGIFLVAGGGSEGDATATPTASASADPSAAPSGEPTEAVVYTTPDSSAAIASSLVTAPYLDGVLATQPGTWEQEKVEERDTEGGYAADGTYKNVSASPLPTDPTEAQISVSWYTDPNGARDAFRAQFDQTDAVFIDKFKSQFTTKSPYLDGQMLVRTVRDEGQFLVTALCIGPTNAEAILVSCTQNIGNAQGRATGTQFGTLVQ